MQITESQEIVHSSFNTQKIGMFSHSYLLLSMKKKIESLQEIQQPKEELHTSVQELQKKITKLIFFLKMNAPYQLSTQWKKVNKELEKFKNDMTQSQLPTDAKADLRFKAENLKDHMFQIIEHGARRKFNSNNALEMAKLMRKDVRDMEKILNLYP